MKTDPGIPNSDEFTKAFGTPRDAELAEDFFLTVKVFFLVALAAGIVGVGIEIGRAVARAMIGGGQ